MAIFLTLSIIVFASVFLFPDLYLEVLKKFMKKVREDHVKDFGYQKMIEDLGPLKWWEEKPEAVKRKRGL